jgi:hypothetical protein
MNNVINFPKMINDELCENIYKLEWLGRELINDSKSKDISEAMEAIGTNEHLVNLSIGNDLLVSVKIYKNPQAVSDFKHISEILCDVMGRIVPQSDRNIPPEAERGKNEADNARVINNEN